MPPPTGLHARQSRAGLHRLHHQPAERAGARPHRRQRAGDGRVRRQPAGVRPGEPGTGAGGRPSVRRGVSELEKAGLTALPARLVKPPRILECPRHFECRVEWTKAWSGRLMVVGEVVAASVDADKVDAEGTSCGTGSGRPTTAARPTAACLSWRRRRCGSTSPTKARKWTSSCATSGRCSRRLGRHHGCAGNPSRAAFPKVRSRVRFSYRVSGLGHALAAMSVPRENVMKGS